MQTSPDLMKPDAVSAEVLLVSVKTLANWRSQRIGPPYLKINGTVRYSRKAVEKWLAAQPRFEGGDAA